MSRPKDENPESVQTSGTETKKKSVLLASMLDVDYLDGDDTIDGYSHMTTLDVKTDKQWLESKRRAKSSPKMLYNQSSKY